MIVIWAWFDVSISSDFSMRHIFDNVSNSNRMLFPIDVPNCTYHVKRQNFCEDFLSNLAISDVVALFGLHPWMESTVTASATVQWETSTLLLMLCSSSFCSPCAEHLQTNALLRDRWVGQGYGLLTHSHSCCNCGWYLSFTKLICGVFFVWFVAENSVQFCYSCLNLRS